MSEQAKPAVVNGKSGNTLFSMLGGRKATMLIVAMVLVALRDKLGIGEEDIKNIMYLALGGSGVLALQSSVEALKGK
jgi:hypothetical protein